jgi:hypothetical protein
MGSDGHRRQADRWTSGQRTRVRGQRRGDRATQPLASVEIAVLAELYRQHQEGNLKLDDPYIVNAADLVPDSNIMGGLTPGVTRVTNRQDIISGQ